MRRVGRERKAQQGGTVGDDVLGTDSITLTAAEGTVRDRMLSVASGGSSMRGAPKSFPISFDYSLVSVAPPRPAPPRQLHVRGMSVTVIMLEEPPPSLVGRYSG